MSVAEVWKTQSPRGFACLPLDPRIYCFTYKLSASNYLEFIGRGAGSVVRLMRRNDSLGDPGKPLFFLLGNGGVGVGLGRS